MLLICVWVEVTAGKDPREFSVQMGNIIPPACCGFAPEVNFQKAIWCPNYLNWCLSVSRSIKSTWGFFSMSEHFPLSFGRPPTLQWTIILVTCRVGTWVNWQIVCFRLSSVFIRTVWCNTCIAVDTISEATSYCLMTIMPLGVTASISGDPV